MKAFDDLLKSYDDLRKRRYKIRILDEEDEQPSEAPPEEGYGDESGDTSGEPEMEMWKMIRDAQSLPPRVVTNVDSPEVDPLTAYKSRAGKSIFAMGPDGTKIELTSQDGIENRNNWSMVAQNAATSLNPNIFGETLITQPILQLLGSLYPDGRPGMQAQVALGPYSLESKLNQPINYVDPMSMDLMLYLTKDQREDVVKTLTSAFSIIRKYKETTGKSFTAEDEHFLQNHFTLRNGCTLWIKCNSLPQKDQLYGISIGGAKRFGKCNNNVFANTFRDFNKIVFRDVIPFKMGVMKDNTLAFLEFLGPIHENYLSLIALIAKQGSQYAAPLYSQTMLDAVTRFQKINDYVTSVDMGMQLGTEDSEVSKSLYTSISQTSPTSLFPESEEEIAGYLRQAFGESGAKWYFQTQPDAVVKIPKSLLTYGNTKDARLVYELSPNGLIRAQQAASVYGLDNGSIKLHTFTDPKIVQEAFMAGVETEATYHSIPIAYKLGFNKIHSTTLATRTINEMFTGKSDTWILEACNKLNLGIDNVNQVHNEVKDSLRSVEDTFASEESIEIALSMIKTTMGKGLYDTLMRRRKLKTFDKNDTFQVDILKTQIMRGFLYERLKRDDQASKEYLAALFWMTGSDSEEIGFQKLYIQSGLTLFSNQKAILEDPITKFINGEFILGKMQEGKGLTIAGSYGSGKGYLPAIELRINWNHGRTLLVVNAIEDHIQATAVNMS